jgi:hypothetical protein
VDRQIAHQDRRRLGADEGRDFLVDRRDVSRAGLAARRQIAEVEGVAR